MPLILATMLLMMAGPAADAPDTEAWSRFRGPNGSGVSVSTHLPAELGPAKNVVWKTALPFVHSSPALTRDRIFLTGTRGDRLVTIGLDRRSVRIVLEQEAPRLRDAKLDTRIGPSGLLSSSEGVNVYVSFADFDV